jgi:hypothetical protein
MHGPCCSDPSSCTGPEASCGDFWCNSNGEYGQAPENCTGCPVDCNPTGGSCCGDGICDGTESCGPCPSDCCTGTYGDYTCHDRQTCAENGNPGYCCNSGNGFCGISAGHCSSDVCISGPCCKAGLDCTGPSYACGDELCSADEDCIGCPTVCQAYTTVVLHVMSILLFADGVLFLLYQSVPFPLLSTVPSQCTNTIKSTAYESCYRIVVSVAFVATANVSSTRLAAHAPKTAAQTSAHSNAV